MRSFPMTFNVALCLLLSVPSGAGAQTAPSPAPQAQTVPAAEPEAPKPTEAVQKILDEASKASQARKFDETLQAADRALAEAKQANDAVGRAGAHRARALALMNLNRDEEAVAVWRQATTAWEQVGDGPGRIEALGQIGVLLTRSEQVAAKDEARRVLEQAIAVSKAESKRPLAAAQVLSSIGESFHDRGTLDQAKTFWETALAIFQAQAPGSLDMANNLNSLGNVAYDRGDLASAEHLYKQTLNIVQALKPGSLKVAASLGNLGNVAYSRGDLASAENYHKQALAIFQVQAPGSLGVANSLSNLGVVTTLRGDLNAAENYYKQALNIFQAQAPGSLSVAKNLSNLGVVTYRRGDLSAAEKYHKQALMIKQVQAPGSLSVAASLGNLGVVAHHRGDLSAAENYYKQALAIRQVQAPSSLDVAVSLGNLGDVAYERSDFGAAENYYEQSLDIFQAQAPGSSSVARSLNALGNVAYQRSDLGAAENYYKQTLNIFQVQAPGSLDVAISLGNLGNVAIDRSDFGAAENYYKQALDIFQAQAPGSLSVASSLNALGDAAYRRNDLSAAENYYKQALAIRQVQAPGSLDVAVSLHDLSNVAYSRRDLGKAEQFARQAWNIVRSQAADVTGDEARQAFGEANQQYSARLTRYQIGSHRPGDAFLTLEQGRSQALQQLLLERRLLAQTGQSKGGDTLRAAFAQRDRAQQALDQASVQQTLAQRELAIAKEKKGAAPEIARLQKALDAVTGQVPEARAAYTRARVEAESRWADIKRANPRVFAEPLSLEKARAALPTGALFVAFSVGEDETTLFLVAPSGPKQQPARAFVLPIKQTDLRKQVATLRAAVALPATAAPDEAARLGRGLFAALFPPEARRALLAARRLIVSPDDVLWELPFAALVTDAQTNAAAAPSPRFLGLTHPLTYAPSLTLFAQSRADKPKLARGAAPVALVLGNPVFDRRSTTAAAAQKPAAQTTQQVAALPRAQGERSYLWDSDAPPPPLPATGREAAQVAAQYRSKPLTKEAATEANVRQRIGQADVLHLATHGVLRRDVPMASGLLLTAPQTEPPPGETANDGALQAWELFGMRLRAEVAVLSACETGLGVNRRGEGIIGLTRALQYAGVRSIVASQWRVQDASTAALMVTFHQELRAGVAKDEALRRAMQTVQRDPKTAHPYYWAPFFLSGDPDNPNLAASTLPRKRP